MASRVTHGSEVQQVACIVDSVPVAEAVELANAFRLAEVVHQSQIAVCTVIGFKRGDREGEANLALC